MDNTIEQTQQFWKDLENPARGFINDTLINLGVFIWGDRAFSIEKGFFEAYDYSELSHLYDEMNVSTDDLLEDELDRGLKLNFYPPKGKSLQIESSPRFPVDPKTLEMIQHYLDSFDAVVFGEEIYNNNYFKSNLPHAYNNNIYILANWEDNEIEYID